MASFFHVLFDREPFRYGGVRAKERGLNWEGLNREEYSSVARFFDQATHPDPDKKYKTVAEALAVLALENGSETEVEIQGEKLKDLKGEPPSNFKKATGRNLGTTRK